MMRWITVESYLFLNVEAAADTLVVEGWHQPGSLTRASGTWIHAAGSAMLEGGTFQLKPHDQPIWLAVEDGSVELHMPGQTVLLRTGEATFLPINSTDATLVAAGQFRCMWLALDGPLSSMVVKKMGGLPHTAFRQTALPSHLVLARQIVQVIVHHSGTDNATYQLQHLLYGMLASQWGQPVAMDAMLSHEISRVVDDLRANKYKDNKSLAEMAYKSRMPMETFRKRFVSEVGMPPLSYVLHCKMERAKELLLEKHYSVRDAGIEVGMKDPYHFSKQFKNVVGISPTEYIKLATPPEAKAKKRAARKRVKKEEQGE